MLTELCQDLRNWFDRDRYDGTFTISGGTLTADFLVEGQYFRIIGSIFNDGVYKYGNESLIDEEFDGSVWALAIPQEVVQLADDISAWREKYEAADSPANSPYLSESFGGYSYTKGSANNGSASGASWKTVFAPRLNRWRKIL